jgi:putative Holliday junction resolvase
LFDRPIYLVDERFSTITSNRKLREVGINERKGKSIIDQIAAIGILESAIENERSNRTIGDLI